MTSKYACMFKSGLYSRCQLDAGKECPYLKEVAAEISDSESTKKRESERIRDILNKMAEAIYEAGYRKGENDGKG